MHKLTNRSMLLCTATLSLFSLALSPGHPKSAGQTQFSEEELLLLPAYCKDRLQDQGSSRKWKQILGPEYLHIQHYCDALNFLTRVKRRGNPQNKRTRRYLQRAKSGIEYTLRRTDDNFALAPDLHISMGEVFLFGGNAALAEKSFLKATKLNPQYPQAWIALSNHYKYHGDTENARKALKQGLQEVPEKYTGFLERRLEKLSAN